MLDSDSRGGDEVLNILELLSSVMCCLIRTRMNISSNHKTYPSPHKKITTNNKYEFCSLSTLDLYLPQTSCRIAQGIPEDLSTSPPPPPDTAPVHIRFAWSFARRCMRCLRALEACSFFSKAMLCLVGTS